MFIVVALGGHALSPLGLEGNVPAQFRAARAAMSPIVDRMLAGDQVLITHGNGPQVGSVLRRVELSASQIYTLPMDIVVADTQAGMGYMICQCLMNELAHRGHPRLCTTVVTTVCVDANDPLLHVPQKPVGPIMTSEQAHRHAREDGWHVTDEPQRGWRRIVPSPRPREIVELPLLSAIVEHGWTVVAAGGGGIPVIRDGEGRYVGIDAVIDKDHTSAILAADLGADMLAILTSVEQVQRDFGTPTALGIDRLTIAEARTMIAQHQFAPGSMLSKIEASVDFLERSRNARAEVLVTSCERFGDGMSGRRGTRIVRE